MNNTIDQEILLLWRELDAAKWESYKAINADDPEGNLINEKVQFRLRDWDSIVIASPMITAYVNLLKIECNKRIYSLAKHLEFEEKISISDKASILLELCRRRNEEARNHGYNSYPEVALRSQGFKVASNLGYSAILDYITEPSTAILNDFPQIGHVEKFWSLNDQVFTQGRTRLTLGEQQFSEIVADLLSSPEIDANPEDFELDICRNARYAGVVCWIGKDLFSPKVGIMVRSGDERSLFTLMHEVGHALLYLKMQNSLGYIPAWLDESYAIALENNKRLFKQLFLKHFSEVEIDRMLELHKKLKLLTFNLFYASMLTEVDIWHYCDMSSSNDAQIISQISRRCNEHYMKYLGCVYENELGWANDTFRSSDPIYIHSYILGEMAAEKCIGRVGFLYEVSESAVLDSLEFIRSEVNLD